MGPSNVSSVTNYFSTASEGFITTLGSSILPGATAVPLTTTSGLTNGAVFVGIIEPGITGKMQVFTGVVDTTGSQITSVVWTRGSNTSHTAGATIVDYVTGTGHNMTTKGILVHANQDGTLKSQINLALTTPKISNSINDSNGNELIDVIPTASAVNELTLANAATSNSPTIAAAGSDTNINVSITGKGTGGLIWKNPYKFGAYKITSSQSVNDGTKITFETEDYDTSSNYDNSTSRFTAPITGLYSFHSQAYVSSNNTFSHLTLNINGSGYRRGDAQSSNTTGDNIISGNWMGVQLTTGDYVEVFFSLPGGGTRSITNISARGTYFEGRFESL